MTLPINAHRIQRNRFIGSTPEQKLHENKENPSAITPAPTDGKPNGQSNSRDFRPGR